MTFNGMHFVMNVFDKVDLVKLLTRNGNFNSERDAF